MRRPARSRGEESDVGSRRHPDSFVCRGCGETITRHPSPMKDNRRTYCSPACKLKTWRRTHDKKYQRSAAATERRKNKLAAAALERKLLRQQKTKARLFEQRHMAYAATAIRECRLCGAIFIRPLFRPGLWNLCKECKPLAAKESRRRSRELHGRKPSERARRRGLPYERCGPIAVCTRDRWRCQLCGVKTPRRLRGTYDMRAPEIDHIIPLSHPDSPGHVWSNVQCVCRQCNLRKSNKPLGQLRLAV